MGALQPPVRWSGAVGDTSLTVIFESLTFIVMLGGVLLLDALVRPRPHVKMRTLAGSWLLVCLATVGYGAGVALCGNGLVAAAIVLALQGLLTIASNAKFAMLGEPLVFSDLALVGAVFRHPQFYLSAVPLWLRIVVALAAGALVGVVAWLSVGDVVRHLAGLALASAAVALLAGSLRVRPWRMLALRPDLMADTCRLGLVPVLLLYWRAWRADAHRMPHGSTGDDTPAAPVIDPGLVVVIQCESFADPAELFDGAAAARLPGLEAARAEAWQWGDLHVSGFGAYTMRTEYGVVFGREEEALGFRRYDPFLTAMGDAPLALAARLKGWRGAFLHPHDLRFYGRDRIMPAAGFVELVGEDRFAPPVAGEGRYVTDAAMADTILAMAKAEPGPALYYAVTIENHGPWAPAGGGDRVDGYLRVLRHGDAMLTLLREGLATLARDRGRPALLVFFGDHRPSIPGATAPGGDRHTPYVILAIDAAGQAMRCDHRRVDLTPAALHHAILDLVSGSGHREA